MTKGLRVALVCDWLTEIGGAEQVLLQLTKLFPGAPIYTSQYRPKTAPWFKGCDVRTGWLNIFPRGLRKFMAPLRAIYFNHLKLRDYDVVISVCNAECKGLWTPDSTLHIAYLQGPPTQYYWGQYDRYIENPGFGKLNWLARWGLKLFLKPMRRSDYRAAQRPDLVVANSDYVLDEMKRYYGRDGAAIHPPVQVAKMRAAAKSIKAADVQGIKRRLFGGQDFYVVVGRQVNWKRFDLAVSACGKSGENLLVIGDGPEHDQLVRLAAGQGNIKFLPRYNNATEIAGYYRAAKGLIFPSLEPFGIVPVEALACGLPVLALHQGGALDMIKDGQNGLFFDNQTVDSLAAGLSKFNVAQFKQATVARSANAFCPAEFERRFSQLIEQNFEVGRD